MAIRIVTATADEDISFENPAEFQTFFWRPNMKIWIDKEAAISNAQYLSHTIHSKVCLSSKRFVNQLEIHLIDLSLLCLFYILTL